MLYYSYDVLAIEVAEGMRESTERATEISQYGIVTALHCWWLDNRGVKQLLRGVGAYLLLAKDISVPKLASGVLDQAFEPYLSVLGLASDVDGRYAEWV